MYICIPFKHSAAQGKRHNLQKWQSDMQRIAKRSRGVLRATTKGTKVKGSYQEKNLLGIPSKIFFRKWQWNGLDWGSRHVQQRNSRLKCAWRAFGSGKAVIASSVSQGFVAEILLAGIHCGRCNFSLSKALPFLFQKRQREVSFADCSPGSA